MSATALIIGLLSIVGVIVSDVGLLVSKMWGAQLHLCSLVVGTVALGFMGPRMTNAIGDTMGTLGSLISGLIVGLAFFTDSLRPVEPVEHD